jgi:hypothetical protein
MNGLPKLPLHRPSAAVRERYEIEVAEFCAQLQEVASRQDFRISGGRGWAYILEGERVINKDDIDAAEKLINDCRKNGSLPVDICGEDSKRAVENLEDLDNPNPRERAQEVINYVNRAENYYYPFSFWDDQEFYVQVATEKADLKNLFTKTCAGFYVPIANWGGWGDLNVRAGYMRRFKEKEVEGKQCVLLCCYDFDPGGLQITNFLRSNLEDMAGAEGVDWSPEHLIIDRFGLNYDYIEKNKLVWINNLITSNKDMPPLDSKKHPDHFKPYVQDYLKRYGARKVEANALLKNPEKARGLCRQAILKYVPENAVVRFERKLSVARGKMRKHLRRLLEEAAE